MDDHFPDSSLARRLALDAIARGWLDISGLWLAANRAQRLGATADVHEIFEGLIPPVRIAELQRALLLAQGETFGIEGDARPPKVEVEDIGSTPTIGFGSPENPANVRPPSGTKATNQLSSERTAATRYVFGSMLGEGGMGRVVSAIDTRIGRMVAVKTLRSPYQQQHHFVRRFLTEARITGQLEHPGVIPVHDVGTLPDGEPFYTMRVVEQRSLRAVLDDVSARENWSLARLCTVFVQICRAMAYAHARGVVHRDLKPENILLGDYGEVYVADWGIAKVEGEDVSLHEGDGGPSRRVSETSGMLMGTAGYIAPEQLESQPTNDARSDLFSLGVILYELLAWKKPFHGASIGEVLANTVMVAPEPPRKWRPDCPLLLEELCMRLLAKNPALRPQTADIVASEVEAYLDGAKEKARRQTEAISLAAQARARMERCLRLEAERDEIAIRAKQLSVEMKSWEPVSEKRKAWALEDRVEEADVQFARELAACVESYSQALGYDPQCAPARKGLADLYWSRMLRAESLGERASQEYNVALLKQFPDSGYAALLSTDARVSIATHPAGAEVVAYRHTEVDRVLRPMEPRSLGTTPLREVNLPAGSWMLEIHREGYRTTRHPLVSRRGEHHEMSVNLYTDAEIGKGMIYVPSGIVRVGGDPEAHDPLPAEDVLVGDFAIGEFPITMNEYLEFVNALESVDPALAWRRSPRLEQLSDVLAVRGNDRVWRLSWETIVEGAEAQRYCPRERVGDLPAFCMDWFDAVAYCAWRGARDGQTYRLPAEVEYEKAARGADGRRFPWGDRFDASFCKMRHSRPGRSQPEPVGAFATDQSPYGVRDLAGGLKTWTADVHGSLSIAAALAEPEPMPGTPRESGGLRIARGGYWDTSAFMCRSATRDRNFPASRNSGYGLRLAKALGRR